MRKYIRYFLIFISAVQLILALAYFLQWPFATGLWPFEGTTPLTFIFISSILAAAGASTLWAAATRNDGALAGIGLDYLAILAPASIYAFQQGGSQGNPQITTFGVICLVGALFGLGLFLWSVRIPLTDDLPMPLLVRISFGIFVIVLMFVSVRLILQVPNTIPWKITPELSVLIGWMFIGAALYFAYGVARPSWLNAAGQLIGFLAYDLVLIVPFITRLPTTPPEFRFGLTIYTAVIIYSGLLAIYYLLFHPPTRARTWRHSSGVE